MFNFELLTQSHVAHVWSDTNGNILIAEKNPFRNICKAIVGYDVHVQSYLH